MGNRDVRSREKKKQKKDKKRPVSTLSALAPSVTEVIRKKRSSQEEE